MNKAFIKFPHGELFLYSNFFPCTKTSMKKLLRICSLDPNFHKINIEQLLYIIEDRKEFAFDIYGKDSRTFKKLSENHDMVYIEHLKWMERYWADYEII